MTKEWTLEGKSKQMVLFGGVMFLEKGETCPYGFHEKDIERLRQELIKDFTKEFRHYYQIMRDEFSKDNSEEGDAEEDVKNIINKRFGVEE